MARTVDTGSTFEDWRQKYNDLVTDVGDPTALNTGVKDSLVNAVNYIMDQYFFFQDFDFDGSDGASSNTVFSGQDNAGNTLQYMASKVLVYKNGLLLRSGTDYTAVNGTSVTLTSSANNGDVIRISSYTGSYTATPSGQESNYIWSTAGGVIHNRNDAGIVFNSTSTTDTTLDVANSFQFNGPVYAVEDVYINNQKDLRFKEASGNGSNYVAVQAPASIGTNRTLTLPDAEDGYMLAVAAVGSSGQVLSSDGDGSYSWTNVSNTNTTYSTSWVDSGDNAILRLTDSSAGTDDLTIVAGTGITVTPSGDNLTIAQTSSTNPTVITVADESSDTTCFPAFFTAATGDLGPKTGSNLTFNSSSGVLTSTGFAGPITGNVTGNVAGTLTGTVATSTQNSITTMTGLVTVGTIGTGVWQGTAIAQSYIAADAINGSKIANDSINSEHYAGGSIDLEHMAANSVDSDQYVNGSIDLEHLNAGMIQLSSESFADNNTSLMTSAAIADKIEAYGYTTETGDITGVTAGTGMSGGGTSGTVTLTNAGVTSAVAGSNISVSGATGAVTITATNTTYSVGDGGLTTNDFTNADHTKLNGIATGATNTAAPHYTSAIAVGDGGLTQNNFTNTLKTKLDGIATGATNTAAPHYTSAIAVGDGGLTQNNFTNTLKTKLDGITASANNYTHPNHSGHVTSSADGATTIASGVVTSTMIVDGTIVAGDIASNAITTAKINADAVTAAKIGNDVINSEHYAAGSIDNEHLANDAVTQFVVGDGSDNQTYYPLFVGSATGNLLPKTGSNLTFNGSSGLLSVGGAITATGDITAFASSDIALKENLINIPNPLEKISKISGYMFDWKDHKDPDVLGEGHDVGIIAQEIEKVLPEVVITRANGKKAVNYQKIIPLLVESIKELKTELDDLKSSNS